MQTYVDEKLGGDGGRIQLVNDDGTLKLQLSFPFQKFISLAVPKVRTPAIELVKKVIPGEKLDGYAVNIVDGILKMVGYDGAPAPAAAPEVQTAPQA